MKNLFCIIFCCFVLPVMGLCDVSLHFQYVFGGHKTRVKHMKADTLFDSQIQVDLAKAAERGDTNKIRLLIDRGADVNCRGKYSMRPLFWALINKNIKGVRFLLDNGADPNPAVEMQNPPAENALTMAASMDESQFLQELLKHGANPNTAVPSSGATAIATAVFYRQTNNIAVLLAAGAEIDLQDKVGNTPLHHAIFQTAFSTALFLYRRGADPLIKNQIGYNALDVTRKFGDRGILFRADKKAYKEFVAELRANQLIE